MRCEARLLTFMYSPLSTEACMRRASLIRSINGIPEVTCHPIGDENVAVPLPMRTADQPPANESVMLLLTRVTFAHVALSLENTCRWTHSPSLPTYHLALNRR